MITLVLLWTALSGLGWCGFALTFRWLKHLPDGGYGVGRLVGLLIWALLVGVPWSRGWIEFTPATGRAGLAIVIAAALIAVAVQPELRARVPRMFDRILAADAVFVGCGAVFAFLVSHHADVLPASGERFMDYTFIQSICRSRTFPVEDPWFAGECIPYYYFGHFALALVQSSLSLPEFGFFPCATATVQALMALGAFSLGLSLRGRIGEGLLALYLIAYCGTLQPLTLAAHQGVWRPIDWFLGARTIHESMTEWPAFIWIFADLHAHVIALPIYLLSLVFAVAFLRGHREAAILGGSSWDRSFLPLPSLDVVPAAIVTGVLMATNVLDGVSTVCLWALIVLAVSIPAGWRGLLRGAAIGVLIVTTGLIIGAPFSATLAANKRELAWVAQPSGLIEYLTHWAIPLGLLVVGSVPAVEALRRRFPRRVALALTLSLVSLWARPDAIGLLVSVLILTVLGIVDAALTKEPQGPERTWILAAALHGLVLLLVCEIFYVRVVYGPTDVGRAVMTNKLFVQSWLLLGGAAVGLMGRWWDDLMPWLSGLIGPGWRVATMPLVIALLALGTFYPVLGAISVTQFFQLPRRLWAGEAIQQGYTAEWMMALWLRGQPGPRRVVLEAPGESYTWHGRITSLSGSSTPLAWTYHEASWRHSWDLVQKRRQEVEDVYRCLWPRDRIEAWLDRFRVEFVVVGDLETRAFPGGGPERLVAPYARVAQSGRLQLFRRTIGMRPRDVVPPPVTLPPVPSPSIRIPR